MRTRILAAVGATFALLVAAVTFVVLGVNGVAFGWIPVRVEVTGATLDPAIRMKESWYTRHPGEGGFINLWPGNETVFRSPSVHGGVIETTLRRRSWCFFPQRLEGVDLGPIDLRPIGGDVEHCLPGSPEGVIRYEWDSPFSPACIAYDPERATSIEIRIDAAPMNLIWARANPELPRHEGHQLVPPGVVTEFTLTGARTADTWPSAKNTDFDAHLTAVAVDATTWGQLLGPGSFKHVTRAQWDRLFAAAAHSAADWGVDLDGDRLRITAPSTPGDVAEVAVAGFGANDQRMQVAHVSLEVDALTAP